MFPAALAVLSARRPDAELGQRGPIEAARLLQAVAPLVVGGGRLRVGPVDSVGVSRIEALGLQPEWADRTSSRFAPMCFPRGDCTSWLSRGDWTFWFSRGDCTF